jgi:hypothetical protein
MHTSDKHFAPGLLPWATLVHESIPVVDHKPAFLFPPPLLLFINELIFLALPVLYVIYIYQPKILLFWCFDNFYVMFPGQGAHFTNRTIKNHIKT